MGVGSEPWTNACGGSGATMMFSTLTSTLENRSRLLECSIGWSAGPCWTDGGRTSAGCRPEDHVGKDIELLGLADRLGRVLGVKRVAPGDQVVEKLHDGGLAVGRDASARHHVRIERVGYPREDRILSLPGR